MAKWEEIADSADSNELEGHYVCDQISKNDLAKLCIFGKPVKRSSDFSKKNAIGFPDDKNTAVSTILHSDLRISLKIKVVNRIRQNHHFFRFITVLFTESKKACLKLEIQAFEVGPPE